MRLRFFLSAFVLLTTGIHPLTGWLKAQNIFNQEMKPGVAACSTSIQHPQAGVIKNFELITVEYFDSSGNKTKEDFFDRDKVVYTESCDYDPSGRLVRYQSTGMIKFDITYTYITDNAGRVSKINKLDNGTEIVSAFAYQPDSGFMVTIMKNGKSVHFYEYNQAGKLIKDSNSMDGPSLVIQRDKLQNILLTSWETIDPVTKEISSEPMTKFDYDYDNQGRIISIRKNGILDETRKYNLQGDVVESTHYKGKEEKIYAVRRMEYQYY